MLGNTFVFRNLHYRILNQWPLFLWVLLATGGTCLAIYCKSEVSCFGYVDCERTKLSSLEDGLLAGVNVKVGDRVEVGDVLVEFDRDLLDAEIGAKRHGLEREGYVAARRRLVDLQNIDLQIQQWNLRFGEAESEYAYLSDELERIKPLVSKGLISNDELFRSQARLEEVQFSLDRIPDILENLRLNRSNLVHIPAGNTIADGGAAVVAPLMVELDRARLVATQAGVVSQIFAGEGEAIAATEPVVEIVHLDRIQIKGFLPLVSFDDLAIGDHVVVNSLERGVTGVSGVVSSVLPVVERGEDRHPSLIGKTGCWFSVDLDEGGELLVGETVDISVPRGESWIDRFGAFMGASFEL